MLTLDLFAEAAAPSPTPALKTPDPERLAYVLTPTGEANRWTYRGELVMYDAAKHVVPGRGRWSTIEGVAQPEVRGDSHVDVCKAIDARLGPAGFVDCGECPLISTGCAAGTCLRTTS